MAPEEQFGGRGTGFMICTNVPVCYVCMKSAYHNSWSWKKKGLESKMYSYLYVLVRTLAFQVVNQFSFQVELMKTSVPPFDLESA